MLPIFAQQVELMPAAASFAGAVITLAVVLVFAAAPLFLLIRNDQRRREWEHAERMRAMEMGLPVPPYDAPWAKAAVCVALGAGVPTIAYAFTMAAYHTNSKAPGELWVAPGVVSGLSVVGACILAGALFHRGPGSSRPPEHDLASDRRSGPVMKPSHDPDAIDVVGRRG